MESLSASSGLYLNALIAGAEIETIFRLDVPSGHKFVRSRAPSY